MWLPPPPMFQGPLPAVPELPSGMMPGHPVGFTLPAPFQQSIKWFKYIIYLNGCYFIKTLNVIGFCSFCLHATPITRKALLLALRGAGRRLELRLKEIARAVEGGEVGAKVRAFRSAGRMAEVRWESQLGRTSDLSKKRRSMRIIIP